VVKTANGSRSTPRRVRGASLAPARFRYRVQVWGPVLIGLLVHSMVGPRAKTPFLVRRVQLGRSSVQLGLPGMGAGGFRRELRLLFDALKATAEVAPRVTVAEARGFAEQRVIAQGLLEPLSAKRYFVLWSKFERFAAAVGCRKLGDIDSDLVKGFVLSRSSAGEPPSLSTMRLRRASLKSLFKVLFEAGMFDYDPTFAIALDRRSYPTTRTLTDEEIAACRSVSLATLFETRQPTIWALAEVGAATSEIGKVTAADIDFDRDVVFLPGGPKVAPREVPLSEWPRRQLARRIKEMGDTGGSLTYDGGGDDHSRRTAITAVLSSILRRGGLAHDQQVGPRSISAWLGRRVLAESGRIDLVALRLGVRSLDLAAEIIGFDWSDPGAP
jgi:integrase